MVEKEITSKVRKYFEMKTHQNLWNATKVILIG